jgi:GrpB-like predicted nucleotidyltransferase (UPF0157 family)
MSDGIIISDYNAEWPDLFIKEKSLILSETGKSLLSLDHIGSTSIPGLAAKPVIDMLGCIEKFSLDPDCLAPLLRLGYEYKGEHGIPERLFFSKQTNGMRSHHLHVVQQGNPFWDEHILFRDYLRANPEIAQNYENLKRDLAQKFHNDRLAYVNGKDEFIKNVLRTAKL